MRIGMVRTVMAATLGLALVTAAPAAAQQALRVGLYGEIVTHDPHVERNRYGIVQLRNIYEPLVDLKVGSTQLEGVLATAWKVSDDGKTYTFQLRPNVVFTDGTPFNAETVKVNIERIQKLKLGPYLQVRPVARVETAGEREVRITLDKPFSPFLRGLVLVRMISPTALRNHDGGDSARKWLVDNSAGTGPYKVVSWAHGQEFVYGRNPAWWGKPAAKGFERVSLRVISEPSTQQLMLEKGDLDIIQIFNRDDLARLRANPRLEIAGGLAWEQQYIQLNGMASPTNDRKVRQALSHLWNPEDYITLMGGTMLPSDGPVPSDLIGAKGGQVAYQYNPDKARSLLREAGVQPGTPFIMHYNKGDETKRLTAELYQGPLAQAGFNVRIEVDTWPAQLKFMTDWFKAPSPQTARHGNLFNSSPRYATGWDMMYYLFHSDARGGVGSNFMNYSNPRVDALLNEAATVQDEEKSLDLIRQASKIVADDAGSLFISRTREIVPMQKYIKGYVHRKQLTQYLMYHELYRD
jgi:peptide/nickel transport system substrate-binding protein